MTTTSYVTSDSAGVVTLIARAVDPNGNPITEQTTITITPFQSIRTERVVCYNAILALSPVQDTIESACAQFGVANSYYIGNPRNTIYSTDSCADLAMDGFYKTEDGGWVNINGGTIRQRGACSAVRTREFVEPGPFQPLTSDQPIPVRIPGTITQEIFVPTQPFTPPSPTTTPPETPFVPQQLPESATPVQEATFTQAEFSPNMF